MSKITPKIEMQNFIAVLGIILIQGALIPSHFSGVFPPLSLPVLVFLGLLCYMYKAIIDNDWVYMLSELSCSIHIGSKPRTVPVNVRVDDTSDR